jgi:hypothetical protein
MGGNPGNPAVGKIIRAAFEIAASMNPPVIDPHDENIALAQAETGRMHSEYTRKAQRKNIACRILRQAARFKKSETKRERARNKLKKHRKHHSPREAARTARSY